MRIREHVRAPSGRCIFCGAAQVENGGYGEKTCLERDIGETALRPEPTLRIAQIDDADTISKRIGELYQQRTEAMNHVDDEPKAELLPEADMYGECYG